MVGHAIPGAINEIKCVIAFATLIITQWFYLSPHVVVADADAKVAQDNIVRAHLNAVVAEHDSIARRILAINGHEGFVDGENGFQRNHAAHTEDNRPWTGRFNRGT